MLRFPIRTAMAVGVILGAGPAFGDDAGVFAPQQGLEELRFAAPLTPQARDRLSAGQALPVIVTFALPEGLEQSRAPGDAAFLERQRLIRQTQNDVLSATFGQRLDQLTAGAEFAQLGETAILQVDPSFSIVPGFSAVLDASAIADIQRHPMVEAVYEDVPGRPLLDESTALIGAPALWAQGLEGSGGAVAILDTGVEKEHPMVGPAITASACFSSSLPGTATSLCPDGSEEMINLTGADAGDACLDTLIDRENGTSGCDHGTHVASIAAGRSATLSRGVISGVARSADIIAINVFSRFPPEDCDDEETHCAKSYDSDQLRALEWVYTNRVQLRVSAVNMSLGGGRHTSPCETHVLRPVIQNLLAADIATVIASGNDGYADAVSAPACVPEAITVGATDKQDNVASFSNSAESLDLLAPGVSIMAALLTEEPNPGENCVINNQDPGADGVCHWFNVKSGTSMAAPHVAGAFTVLRAAEPGASVSDILTALDFTGAQIVDVNGITRSRIQMDAAHTVLARGGVFADTVQLTPLTPFRTSGDAGSAGSFSTLEYTLTNQSGASRTVTVIEKPAWVNVGADSFVIGAGSTYMLRLSVDMTGLPQQTAAGQVRLQVGPETILIPAAIQVQRSEVLAEFGPFEWTGDEAAATQSIFRIAGLRNGPPSRIQVAVGRSASGTYGSDFSDCELQVRPENHRHREYVITSGDLATCGRFGRADLRFRLTVDSQDQLLGLQLRRFGVRASGAVTDFAFDNTTQGASAGARQSRAAASARSGQPVLLVEEAAESEAHADHAAGSVWDFTGQALSSVSAPANTSPESAEFGPFEWAGDANAPTVSIFRISGVNSGAPRSIEVAVGEANAGGYGGVFEDCTLSIRPERYAGREYVVFNSDLAECGAFGRANLSFRVTPHASDAAADIKMRRFAVNVAGGLTDFGFDHDQQAAPEGVDIGGGLRQYEFGPFEWTGDANAGATNVFRLSGVGGGQPESIQVAIANAAQSGFSGAFSDCSLAIRPEGAGAWEYVFSNAVFSDCGAFGRADLTFRITLREGQIGRLVQLRRFALWENDLTDFGFDRQRGQGSAPQALGDGRSAVEFGPFEWTGDRNASTQSSFRVSGLSAAPVEIRVALDNAAIQGPNGTFDDCVLAPSISGFSGGEYLITGNDLATCGDYVRADLRFRIIAATQDFAPVVRMRRFAITTSGGITDFGFDSN